MVPTSALQQPTSGQLQDACSGGSAAYGQTSAAATADVTTVIPWRLRQVSAVEVSAGVDPEDATVLLVGGERLRAGAVLTSLLTDVQDYQVHHLRLSHQAHERMRLYRQQPCGVMCTCKSCLHTMSSRG